MSEMHDNSGDPYLMRLHAVYDDELVPIAENGRRAAISVFANFMSLQTEYDYDLNVARVAEKRSYDALMRGEEEDWVGTPALFTSWIDSDDAEEAYTIAVDMNDEDPKEYMEVVFTTMNRIPGDDDSKVKPPFKMRFQRGDSDEDRKELIRSMATLGVDNLSRIFEMTNKLRPSEVNRPNYVDPEVVFRHSLKYPGIARMSLEEMGVQMIEINPKQQNVYELRLEIENSLRKRLREERHKSGANKRLTTVVLAHVDEDNNDVCLIHVKARRSTLRSSDYDILEILAVKYDANDGNALNFYDNIESDMHDDGPERELSELESNGDRFLRTVQDGSPTISKEDFARAYSHYAFGLHKLYKTDNGTGAT